MIRRRRQFVLAMTALLLLGAATSVLADGEGIVPPPKENTPSGGWEAWGQLLLAMAIVVGLIFALGWLVKRLGGGKAVSGGGALRLVARANLSPKHQIFLVRLGKRLVLLGAGPQGLATLSEVIDGDEVADLLAAAGVEHVESEGGEA